VISKPPKSLHFKILISLFNRIFPINKKLILLLLLPTASDINGKCEHEGMLTFPRDVNKRGQRGHMHVYMFEYVYWHGIWAALHVPYSAT